MTDDEVQVFLSLKFSNVAACARAFAKAVGGINEEIVPNDTTNIAAIKFWAESGAPEKLKIPEDKTSLFINLKYGSMVQAYDLWLRQPPGTGGFFTMDELRLLVDYVPVPRG